MVTATCLRPQDVRDEEGYLKALGMARTAEVKRDARIGEAEAKRDAAINEAIAEEERMASRLMNDVEIAKAQRDFQLKKAAYDMEVRGGGSSCFRYTGGHWMQEPQSNSLILKVCLRL